MSNSAGGFEDFLEDLTNFFYRRRLTYVDIGCYTGEVSAKVFASRLGIREAHLVEPNPKSLDSARQRLGQRTKGHEIKFYQAAMSDAPGRVWMTRSNDMTKVLPDPDGTLGDKGGDNVFEVQCSTLDELAERVTDRRISLLKIDVEGHELRVLAGAANLLRDQRVDVIYLEAGLNPDGTQQCYYRPIEDFLRDRNYRLFRIYEQKHEWMEDSPLLRRVNLAFMSQAFVERNPYRLSMELLQAHQALEKCRAKQNAAEAEHAAQRKTAEAEHSAVQRELVSLRTMLSTVTAERQTLEVQLKSRSEEVVAGAAAALAAREETERARAELSESQASTHRLQSELATVSQRLGWLEHRRDDLQETLSAVVSAVGEMHRRDLARRGELASLEQRFAVLDDSPSVRLGRVLADSPRSASGWIGLPLALWRAWRAQPVPRPVAEPVLGFEQGKTSLALPLSVKAQLVRLPEGDVAHEVWVQLLSATSGATVSLELAIAQDGAEVPPLALEGRAPLGTKPRTLSLKPGVLVHLLNRHEGALPVRLSVRRARGDLCILRIELRAPGSVEPDIANGRDRDDSTAYSSEELEAKLWGGYAAESLAALESRKNLRGVSLAQREDAAWSIARWHYVEGDFQQSLDNLRFIRRLVKKPNRRTVIAEAQCLMHLGHAAEAAEVLRSAMEVWGKGNDLRLLLSTAVRMLALQQGRSLEEAERDQLAFFNEVMRSGEMAPIEKHDPAKPLSLANITARAEPLPGSQEHKVSVIVPAFNAEDAIEWVVDGLLRQTWRNLEVIVVDDLSTDSTCEKVRAIAARDARVRLLAKPVNEGAYPTRNAGALAATGHYITVHDSDDWSHPQKIEMQVHALEASPEQVAVITHWVRVGEHLDVVGPWITRGGLFDVNFSSLLFKRELLNRLGAWDGVKISGDAEFYYRIRALYGSDCVLKLAPRYLLSLSLARDNSLTRSKATHLRSLFYGLRWNYRDAYVWWIDRIDHGDPLIVDQKTGRRRFPAPLGCQAVKPKDNRYDLVVACDFAEDSQACAAALASIAAARAAGSRVAAFHWRMYERPSRAPLHPTFYEAVMRHEVDILSPGDDIEAKSLIFFDAAILNHRIDPAPTVRTQRLSVVVDEVSPAVASGDGRLSCDPLLATRHLEAMFHLPPTWIPMSDAVRDAMAADGRFTGQIAKVWLGYDEEPGESPPSSPSAKAGAER